jgi:uncharacterized membrane protein YGL010W
MTDNNNVLISKSNVTYVGLTFIGLFLSNILNVCGVLTNKAGIDYYAEAHLSNWNSWMHTIGMPFTIYGISCWVPALFGMMRILSKRNQNKLQLATWYVYALHYMSIDVKRGLFCIAFYLYPSYKAYTKTQSTKSSFKSSFKLFLHGFFVSFLALAFQEFIGHSLGGDIPSRSEGVFNAILYAPLYSTDHIV